MKVRIILGMYAILSLLGLLVLLSRENVFMVLAMALGFLLLAHREIWSLIRHGRLPVIDERVRDNLSGAFRITGSFFFIASIILILAMYFDAFEDTPVSLLFSGQLVVVGFVYLVGYHYYDRVRPSLGARGLRWLRICLVTTGISLSTIALAIVLHNFVSMWLGVEEGFFFILGLLGAPSLIVCCLLTSLFIYIVGLSRSFKNEEPAS